MLEDVKAGRTNCIIVKDLLRFGRNYLDAGEYIEKIFLGVRFIAVNDNYDSFGGKTLRTSLSFRSRMSLIFSLLAVTVLMVKDSFLNGIWLNVAKTAITE